MLGCAPLLPWSTPNFIDTCGARSFELSAAELWRRGLVSGELHLATGEEAIAAGVVAHLQEGDGLALTHRCTPALVARGVPVLRELLGQEDGLCHGRGGHMHLLSKPHLAASSGIVGASLPTGAGFALAAKCMRKKCIGVSFVGDGAMNQGMVLETLNLVCGVGVAAPHRLRRQWWAIATPAGAVTGGQLAQRALAFCLATETVDGGDVEAVYQAAGKMIELIRRGKGPGFLLAACPRIDGHFLGDPLLRTARSPVDEGSGILGEVLKGATSRGGGGMLSRAKGLAQLASVISKARGTPELGSRGDPMVRAQRSLGLDKDELRRIEDEANREISEAFELALAGLERRPS